MKESGLGRPNTRATQQTVAASVAFKLNLPYDKFQVDIVWHTSNLLKRFQPDTRPQIDSTSKDLQSRPEIIEQIMG